MLGAILALAASSSSGVALLAVYSLGLGVPFVLAAVFLGTLMARAGRLRQVGLMLRWIAGVVLIAMGVAMMTGHLTEFAFWFLETFPALGQIG